jgi:hypothetical protein
VPNYTAHGNASASAGGRVRREHASLGGDVHLSKHGTSEYAILSVVVQTGRGTGDSTCNVLAAAATA